jgi:hypothetical protein
MGYAETRLVRQPKHGSFTCRLTFLRAQNGSAAHTPTRPSSSTPAMRYSGTR